ncbi:hypothetical protein EDC94DRAFT_618347 [Helicostylum pulchrum]|uniref:RING-type E3 ubiquitin transferase n=1 Tax=Helicostylum pulchrum TaxID=562976 RepID=A0ABP9XX41_9FUNG|nr:hypothetical protein EDC94DRAFT_618347 [Helicostylum pulchrum]
MLGKRKYNEREEQALLPTCTICIQEYSNRTFLRPCYHSFCFTCIRHWINIASAICPVCRQHIDSLVYNIDEEENSFDEYHLKDIGNAKSHDPPLYSKRKYSTPEERLKIERTQVYKGLIQPVSYPDPLPKHVNFTIITPEYIPRTRVFLQHELKAIVGVEAYDEFLENLFVKILLIPYQSDKPVKMNDSVVIDKLSEWLDDDSAIANRLVNELVAYLKSGLSYKHFISAAMYK